MRNINILRADLIKIIVYLVIGNSLDYIRSHHPHQLYNISGEKPGVECFMVGGPVETDETSHEDTEQTGDWTEPHIRNVVQAEVGEAGLAVSESGRGDGGVDRGWKPGGGAVVSGARHQRTEPSPVVGSAEVGGQEAEAPPEDKDEGAEEARQGAHSVGERHKHAERKDTKDGTANLIICAVNTWMLIFEILLLPFRRLRWQRGEHRART